MRAPLLRFCSCNKAKVAVKHISSVFCQSRGLMLWDPSHACKRLQTEPAKLPGARKTVHAYQVLESEIRSSVWDDSVLSKLP